MEQILRHFRTPDNSEGFTLIELIVTTAVLAIIGVVAAGVIVTFMRIFLYLPREMKAKTVAHDIAEFAIEGEPGKPGLRYSAAVTAATATSITYTSGYPAASDQVTMTLAYDTINDRLQRTAGAVTDTIPYYDTSDITVTCPADKFFTYYNAAGSEIAAL